MAVSAGTLFAINGVVSKVILASGISSLRLTEIRSLGAFVVLAAIVLATNRPALRTTGRELLFLATFGIFGVAFVQLFYFLSIHRLDIGVSLVIQYLGIALVAAFS